MTESIDDRIPRGAAVVGTTVEVHFDGACQPPRGGGVATYGFTIRGAGFAFEESGLAVPPWSAHATNNVAEYTAVVRALEWLRGQRFRGTVVARGDSQLVVRQMTGEYRVLSEHLKAYHDHLQELRRQFAEVRFEWIPREENRRADELSKEALARAFAEAARHRPPTAGGQPQRTV